MCSVLNDSYLADISLPSSICFSVGVRYIASECNAFSADFTLCHLRHLQLKDITFLHIPPANQRTTLVLYHVLFEIAIENANFFIILKKFTSLSISLSFLQNYPLFSLFRPYQTQPHTVHPNPFF